jgi:hypothetical protein
LPLLGALAALVFLAGGGSAGQPAAVSRAAGAADAHRSSRFVEVAPASVTNADSVTVRTVDANVFAFAVLGLAAVAAMLGVQLRREQGSYTLPWGTGSTSTRGPPVRPALI